MSVLGQHEQLEACQHARQRDMATHFTDSGNVPASNFGQLETHEPDEVRHSPHVVMEFVGMLCAADLFWKTTRPFSSIFA